MEEDGIEERRVTSLERGVNPERENVTKASNGSKDKKCGKATSTITLSMCSTLIYVTFTHLEFLAEEDIYDLIMFLVTLLPEVEEQSRWSRIIAGLQCALRDCRRAFPRLTTVATPVGNGTFIIRRARSECLCSISRSQDVEKP
ncbi:hypothetical protein ANCCAN_10591 [Ancylostoma caninum]|uniref:Uncharacterized protein n=1 Tax=Ancylostoma caninum TaxID=29170 RepID=A0A368GK35_ANCCA|nr:hypothetical protein ANCCAN_10591 [Ancylostoma caninum]